MVNNLGVDPNEWFRESIPMHEDPPYSSQFSSPLPDGGKHFDWEDTAPCEYEPPRPEEDVCDWFTDNPDESDEIEKEKTMHQKMYEIATSKYNPFSVGGSETLGGSENASRL